MRSRRAGVICAVGPGCLVCGTTQNVVNTTSPVVAVALGAGLRGARRRPLDCERTARGRPLHHSPRASP